MICEFCQKEHDGKFASGRFCNRSCSNGFSTREKRKQINQKVSRKLRRRKFTCFCGKSSHPTDGGSGLRCKEHKNPKTGHEKFENLKCDGARKRRLIKEYGHKCWDCELTTWKNEPIPLQIDHIDGNSDNYSRSNLRILCPNCHAMTPTFSGRNAGKVSGTKRQQERLYRRKNAPMADRT